MKGKKFDAVQKHFQEKEVKLRQEMKHNLELVEKILKENDLLLKENNSLKKENTEIKEQFNKLLEYVKLSENDINTALQKDKLMTQFYSIAGVMSKYFLRKN